MQELIISRCVKKYSKGSSLGQQNMTLARKEELHKEMKTTGNSRHEGKCNIIFKSF